LPDSPIQVLLRGQRRRAAANHQETEKDERNRAATVVERPYL
jgi:hypothetical protein